jgi:hypothetical protein
MSSSSIGDVLACCSQDDPLKEGWLWAQTAGLAIAIAVFECGFFSIANVVVVTYTAIMTKLCFMEFNPNAYTAWQDTACAISLISGVAIAFGAAFQKLLRSSQYGSAAVKRNVHLALGLEDTTRLCLSLLPQGATLQRGVAAGGEQVTLHVQLGRSCISTRHLVIRIIFINTNETAVLINAVPVLNGSWGLLSAFFSDTGRNKEHVASILSDLLPYRSHSRPRAAATARKKAKAFPSTEQILREAPPRLSKTNA